MEQQNEWVFFQNIDWNCKKNNRFNVDTRDFHVGYNFNDELHKDWSTISKYNHFFFTEIELKDLLNRLYEESGRMKNDKWYISFFVNKIRTRKGYFDTEEEALSYLEKNYPHVT